MSQFVAVPGPAAPAASAVAEAPKGLDAALATKRLMSIARTPGPRTAG